MVEALKMIANVKTIMFPKHVTRLKSVLVCGRVLLIVTLLCTLITQTSPYLARRNVHGLVEFPPTNHVGKQLTRAISRGDPLVASFSNPLPSVVVPSASSNLGIISTGPVASIAVVEPPNTLQRLMTPPPPTTGTSTSTSKSLSYSSKFYSNSDSSKDRYANSFHTGGTGTGASRNFNKPSSKSHFNKKSYVGSPYNEKHESSKRYAMTYHTGPSSTTFPETSTSATFIINDYTNKTSIVRLSQNDNFERKQETLNFQNTVPHSGLTGSPGTFSPQASSLPNTHDHLHNIKQQLLHTAYSNNYAHNSHLNTNQLGTGQYNTNNYHTEYTTQGPSAPPSTGFGARQQEIPTVAAATVGASIQFSQNSAQFPAQNTQQPQQPQFSSSWNQNYNVPNQVAQQRHFQQQPSNQFPTGFDPRAQTRLPWANNNNRLPTEYQRIPPSASASGPTGRYNIPFLHHQLAHPYHHGSASNVRPTGFGNIPPATKSPITPTFGQGTTGSYAAVRDPSEMPAEGRREKVTVPPPQPPQVQTPPPLPVQSSTTLGTTTTKRIQETTEPITSASEAESKFIESSTHRAGNGDGGYGWGPEGASSGGNEEGGIANVFVDIVTSKIKSIQATVNGIQAAIKGAKRSGARKIANKIEGIGTFVHAVTKGVGGIFEAKANAYSDNKGWGKGSSSNNNKNKGWGRNSNGGDSDGESGGGGWGRNGNGGGSSGGNGGGGWGSGGNQGGSGNSGGFGGSGSASGGNFGGSSGGGGGFGSGSSFGGGFGSSGSASGGNFGSNGGGGFGNGYSNNNGGGNFGNTGAASGGNFGGSNNGGNFGGSGGFSVGGGSNFAGNNGNGGSNSGGSGGFNVGGGGSFGGNNFGSSASASSNGGGGGYDNSGGGGFGSGGGFGGNNDAGGFGGGSSNIPQSPGPNNGNAGNGNLQGGVIGNANPFEGAAGSNNQGGYSWNQG